MPKRKPRPRAKTVMTYVGRCPVTNKRQYKTEQDARAEAKQYRKRVGPRLTQYECIYCPFWHNGHDRPPERRRQRPMEWIKLRYNKNRQTQTPKVADERAGNSGQSGR